MSDIIKMNFPLMEEMAQAFARGSETLESTINEVNTIAGLLEDGALLGKGGETLAQACRGTLIDALKRLQEKFVELQRDVLGALEDMRNAETDTARLYN